MAKKRVVTKKANKATKSKIKAVPKKVEETLAVASSTMTAKQLSITFVVWMLAHTTIFFLANRFFPEAVALGTDQFSTWQALLFSMLVLTLITVGFIPLVEMIASSAKRSLSAMDWMVTYFVINTAAIWVVARFAEQLGMGISSWVVAVVLALVIDAVQGLLVSKAV